MPPSAHPRLRDGAAQRFMDPAGGRCCLHCLPTSVRSEAVYVPGSLGQRAGKRFTVNDLELR